MLRPGGTAYVSTPNLLTLAPPGAEKSDNPWHVKEYRAEEFRALCESAFDEVELLGLFHARMLRAARAGAARRLGPRARRARHHQALLRPLHARHLRARLRAARRARSTARSTSSRCSGLDAPAAGGALALVLHSHMPYVEGFGTWPFGEEWLWEAVACVYLPLLDVLDGAPVTLGLTPVLCDQLEAMRGEAGRPLPALPARHPRADPRRGRRRPGATPASPSWPPRCAAPPATTRAPSEAFEERGRDLLGAFGALDGVELWTSAATHALLPLLATDAGLRLQVATGTASHVRRFGDWGGGFWLPECAYVPGLERELADHGVRAFCVDQTAVAGLRPPAARSRPSAGPVAVPIDWETVELVWNDERRLPGARHLPRLLRPHRPRPASRGTTPASPYDHEAALELAREHARDFVRAGGRSGCADGGLLCCALDTELLGHWWYEGPAWLGAVLEEARGAGRRAASRCPRASSWSSRWRATLAPSTWGTRQGLHHLGLAAPWPSWPSPPARAELRTVAAVAGHGAPHAALERAARELLAMQASDWAFMVTRDLAGDYPRERMQAHARSSGRRTGCSDRLRGRCRTRPLRGLAPDLDLAPLTTP